MYYESIFSLRQDSTKLCSVPIISYLSAEKNVKEEKTHPWWIHCLLWSFASFQKLRSKWNQGKGHDCKRHAYGRALMMHSCAIDPIDSGAEFHEDALGDRPRFAYGYRKDPIFYFGIISLNCLTGGLTWILFHWFPLCKFILSHQPCHLFEATHVVIFTQKGEEHVAEVLRPGIAPSEAVQFDNWPGFCSFCGLKKKASPSKPLEHSSNVNDELHSYYDLFASPESIYQCKDSVKSYHEDNLSEIYIEEWCTCLGVVCCDMHNVIHGHLLMFQFRLLRYYLNLRENVFDVIHFNTQLNPVTLHKTLGQGITSESVYQSRCRIFGVEKVKPYPLWKIILEELTEPFYVFQVCCVILWVWDEYLEYAYIVITLMILSSLYDIYIVRDCERRVLQLGLELSFSVNAFRYWSDRVSSPLQHLKFSAELYENEALLSQGMKSIEAGLLQPGDLFEIKRDMTIPCDTVLLWGNVVVLETVLSGESVPQTKTPLPGAYHIDGYKQADVINFVETKKTTSKYTTQKNVSYDIDHEYNIDQDTQHTLYAGTYVVALHHLSKGQRVMGLCARTRFSSSHGRLLRSSLFPNGPFFDFNAQALQFFFYMFWFCSLGAIISVITGLHFQFDTKVIIVRALDLFTDALPPALPAILGMGIVVAMRRLRLGHQINCIHAGRINLAGLVDIFVFDKTGTLTEQGLKFNGCFEVETLHSQLNPLETFGCKESKLNPFLHQARILTRRKAFRVRQLLKMYRRNKKPKNLVSSSDVNLLQPPLRSPKRNVSQIKYFGSPQFDPLNIKGYFMEALATCHSLFLVNGQLMGDPLELALIQFTQWKLHDIQEDIFEVKEFLDHLKESKGNFNDTPVDFDSILKIAPSQVVIEQLSLLYKTKHSVPLIMLPRDTSLSLFQQLRRENPFFGFEEYFQTDQYSSHQSLLKCSLPTSVKKTRFNELGILRRFEFSPSLQRVTVIVRDPLTLNVYAYSKGSPEIMATLCCSESLPPTFYSTIAHYTQNGDRVVVVGGKYMGKLGERAINNLTRRRAERRMRLFGFVLFSNCLKTDTKKAIQQLNEAQCRCIIATGDNPLTALSVAETCGIIQRNAHCSKEVILGDLYVSSEHANESADVPSFFIWTKVEKFKTSQQRLLTRQRLLKSKTRIARHRDFEDPHFDVYSLLKKQWKKRVTLELRDFLRGKNPNQCEFILTGRAFRKLRMLHEELRLQWFDKGSAEPINDTPSYDMQQEDSSKTDFPSKHLQKWISIMLKNISKMLRLSVSFKRNLEESRKFDFEVALNSYFSTHNHSLNEPLCSTPLRNYGFNQTYPYMANSFETPESGYTSWDASVTPNKCFPSKTQMSSLSSFAVNSPANDLTGRFSLEPCLVTDNMISCFIRKRYTSLSSHKISKCQTQSNILSRRQIQPNAFHQMKWIRFSFLQIPCTIFNRSTTLHHLKTSRLRRHFELSNFSASSLVHVSIVATGKHPKILSKKHLINSPKRVTYNSGSLLLSGCSSAQASSYVNSIKDTLTSNDAQETQQQSYKANLSQCLGAFSDLDDSPQYQENCSSCSHKNPHDIVWIFDFKKKCCRVFRLKDPIDSGHCSLPVGIQRTFTPGSWSFFLQKCNRHLYKPIDFCGANDTSLKYFNSLISQSKLSYLTHSDSNFPKSCSNRLVFKEKSSAKKLEKPTSLLHVPLLEDFSSPYREVSKLSQLKPDVSNQSCTQYISKPSTRFVSFFTDKSTHEEQHNSLEKFSVETQDSTFDVVCHNSTLKDHEIHYSLQSKPSSLFLNTVPAGPEKSVNSSQAFGALTLQHVFNNGQIEPYHKELQETNTGSQQKSPTLADWANLFHEKDMMSRSEIEDLMLLSVVVIRQPEQKEKCHPIPAKKTQRNPLNVASCITSVFSSSKRSHTADNVVQQNNLCPPCDNAAISAQYSSCVEPSTRYELIRISLFEYLLRNTRIYARMLPEDKTSLITALRSFPHTLAVGMCGDSANDSGALQAADIGVSLNSEEKSVAAPFMSKTGSIGSCVAILCEGRISLENALEMFTFVVFYSMTQYLSVLALYLYGLNFTDNQYLFVDFLVILPLSTLLSEVHVSSKLKASIPKINLFSLGFIVPLIVHITVATFFMFVLLFSLRFTPGWTPFYLTPAAGDSDGPEIASYENTALFYFTNFLYPFMSIIAVAQNRWRKERLKNWIFAASHGVLILIFFLVILLPRPATILIPTPTNSSPDPLPVPPLKSIGWVAYSLVLIDQTLVLVALPTEAKLLIVLIVFCYIFFASAVQIFVLEPYRKQEANLLHINRVRNRSPIPLRPCDGSIRVYHCI